jgi:enamine deaminase RidA (YjgF/YER057c/UK114 family)
VSVVILAAHLEIVRALSQCGRIIGRSRRQVKRERSQAQPPGIVAASIDNAPRSDPMPEQTERLRVASGSPFEPLIGFSRAVRAGDRVLVSGTAPIWPDGSCDPDPAVQAARCLEIVLAALAEAGAGPEDVVRTRTYLVDPADWEAVGRAHGAVFAEVRPASTMVVVAGLLDPRWRVEIEAEAVFGSRVIGDSPGSP